MLKKLNYYFLNSELLSGKPCKVNIFRGVHYLVHIRINRKSAPDFLLPEILI